MSRLGPPTTTLWVAARASDDNTRKVAREIVLWPNMADFVGTCDVGEKICSDYVFENG